MKAKGSRKPILASRHLFGAIWLPFSSSAITLILYFPNDRRKKVTQAVNKAISNKEGETLRFSVELETRCDVSSLDGVIHEDNKHHDSTSHRNRKFGKEIWKTWKTQKRRKFETSNRTLRKIFETTLLARKKSLSGEEDASAFARRYCFDGNYQSVNKIISFNATPNAREKRLMNWQMEDRKDLIGTKKNKQSPRLNN